MGALETATIILENHCRTADTWRAMAGNHWHLYLFDFGLCLCQFRHKHHGECYKEVPFGPHRYFGQCKSTAACMGSLMHPPSRSEGTLNVSNGALNWMGTCSSCVNSQRVCYANSSRRHALRYFTTMHFSGRWRRTTQWTLISVVRQFPKSISLQVMSCFDVTKKNSGHVHDVGGYRNLLL